MEFIDVDDTVLQSHDVHENLPHPISKGCVTGVDDANPVRPDKFVFAAQKQAPVRDESSPSIRSTATGAHQECVLP